MRSKLTAEGIKAIGDQKTASWDEVRVALHESITYLDTELPVFSDGDAAKILYATLARRVSLSVPAKQFSLLNTLQFHLTPTSENKRISKVPTPSNRPQAIGAFVFVN